MYTKNSNYVLGALEASASLKTYPTVFENMWLKTYIELSMVIERAVFVLCGDMQ